MTTTAPLQIGNRLPALTLHDDEGTPVDLHNLPSARTVLYFYPKDDTPGCTTQACAIRDSWSEFESRDDVAVFGVSPQDAASHTKFRAKYDLPFHLLVDTDHALADALGFWVEKRNYGKTYWGIQRSTIIVDDTGTIVALKRNVQPAKHLDWLREQLDES